MTTEQKQELNTYFQNGLYAAVCLNNDKILEELYPQNIIELEMDSDAIFHKETVMIKKDVFLKKDEPYKLIFPVALRDLEHFTLVFSSHNKERNHIACYENTLNSIIIKSHIDFPLLSIQLWTHQYNEIIYC